jgi:hypothetical protein
MMFSIVMAFSTNALYPTWGRKGCWKKIRFGPGHTAAARGLTCMKKGEGEPAGRKEGKKTRGLIPLVPDTSNT